MSMAGEMMEEMYDKVVQDFLKWLENLPTKGPDRDDAILVQGIIAKYKEHFKNNGIYGTS